MDFSKEFKVEIEVIDNDWCTGEQDTGETDQLTAEHVKTDEKLLNNIERCLRCNQLFLDSYSLFQHNVTHLFLVLEKLPDEILDNNHQHQVPYTETDSVINEAELDVSEAYDNKEDDILIKWETVEYDSEPDQIYTEDTNEDLVEGNNNNIPLTKRMHKCNICSKVYNYKHWHAHVNEVHSKIMIKCTLCRKEYKSKKSLRRHACSAAMDERKNVSRIRYKALGSYKCARCSSVFNTKDCMQKHEKNVHSEPVRCDICDSRLGSKAYLAAHIKRVHYNDGRVHSCDLCGKTFKSPRYVKVHMKNSHSGRGSNDGIEEVGLVYVE